MNAMQLGIALQQTTLIIIKYNECNALVDRESYRRLYVLTPHIWLASWPPWDGSVSWVSLDRTPPLSSPPPGQCRRPTSGPLMAAAPGDLWTCVWATDKIGSGPWSCWISPDIPPLRSLQMEGEVILKFWSQTTAHVYLSRMERLDPNIFHLCKHIIR